MKKKWINKKITELNPTKDYNQIVDLLMNWRDNHPFLHHLIYTLSFIRQVADPEIAKIVFKSGAGRMITHTYERANETLRFFGTWYRYGANSEKGIESIEKVNKIHSNFNITNPQYLYTLATIVIYPNHFKSLVGIRQTSPSEKIALISFWKDVGHFMNLKDIPNNWKGFETYYHKYESENFQPSKEGQICCETLIDEFAKRWFTNNPRKGKKFLLAHFDKKLRKVFLFDYPNTLTSFLFRKMTCITSLYNRLFKADTSSPVYVTDSFSKS